MASRESVFLFFILGARVPTTTAFLNELCGYVVDYGSFADAGAQGESAPNGRRALVSKGSCLGEQLTLQP